MCPLSQTCRTSRVHGHTAEVAGALHGEPVTGRTGGFAVLAVGGREPDTGGFAILDGGLEPGLSLAIFSYECSARAKARKRLGATIGARLFSQLPPLRAVSLREDAHAYPSRSETETCVTARVRG